MSYSHELLCVSFSPEGELVEDPVPIGQVLVTAEESTRYQALAQIQDRFGRPYRVSYVQINVLPGRDPDTRAKRAAVRKAVKEALKDFRRFMRGKGGVKSIPIRFTPEKPQNKRREVKL